MYALAQCMAGRKPSEVPKLTKEERLDKRAQLFEMEYVPGEFTRKPSKFCTPEEPCYNIPSNTIWEAMGNPRSDLCPTCTQVISEVEEFTRDYRGWVTTKGGKFELWCAQTQRKKATEGDRSSEQT